MMHDAEQPVVLVSAAQHPTGLMTARSLRDCGAKIIGLAYGDSPCLTSSVWSSLCKAEQTSASILQTIRRIAAEQAGQLLLLPSDDEAVKILSDHRQELPTNCILVLPDSSTVDLLLDKSKFYPWAETHGFNVPKTREIRSFSELEAAADGIGYPLLLKPLYRTPWWDREIPGDKVFILESQQQHARLPLHLFEVAPVMLAQQWIPGTDADVYFCLVCYDQQGNLINHFCGRKLMQWPPLGGSTAVAISDEKEESLETTLAIFNAVGYKGLGSVEYKKDPRDGRLYITEPTVGRNDFQSYIAVAGNVNLTQAFYCSALGLQFKQKRPRRQSAWICETSLINSVRYYLRQRNYYFFRYVFSFFRSVSFAYFDMRDRAPFKTCFKNMLRWKKCSH